MPLVTQSFQNLKNLGPISSKVWSLGKSKHFEGKTQTKFTVKRKFCPQLSIVHLIQVVPKPLDGA
jgi:hypothetical protein